MNKLKSDIKLVLIFFLMISCGTLVAKSNDGAESEDEEYQSVEIVDPFVEFHTGPGRGYPVFHIVEKGEKILLIKKKTEWYKVKSPRGRLGWVHEDELEKTLADDGENYEIDKPDQEGFIARRYETGVLAGDFGGATVMTLHAGWNWTENIATEIAYSQALGNVSDIQFLNLNILHQPFPEWRVSPYVKLGTGIIKVKPNATLVLPEDREDEMVHAGIGAKIYVSRQFFIRAEYNSHTILTSRNDNDEVEEWKLGFSVFF
ncbi:outer membrane beta-barrel protein [Aliikangiella coralliicola]|uniref:SH3 domain-containing protein n=1 Tax=Aliikangiella coralliicola TaxID=2592383 RepID=A0A545UAT1_9GAMM|nr:outer membrane beta-barrel protein [Aliikangiella coralliicola]TQV86581.1 SH3 domain-containing protein [Aliikangiella coralliicola]